MIKAKSNLDEVAPYQAPPSDRIDKIRLDFNEVNLPPTPKLKNLKFDPTLSCVYPQEDSLIESLAEYFKIDPKYFLVCNGSNEAITLILEAFITEGDRVLIPFPTFSVYYLLLQIKGAIAEKICYDKDLNFPVDEFLEKAKINPRLIILVNPNNPTGDMLDRQTIEKILTNAPNSLLVLDEAYVHFAKEELWNLVLTHENVIVLRTFSKAYALAGHRIGFAMSNPATMEQVKKVSLPFRINYFSLMAAQIALNDENHFRQILATVKDEKTKMQDFFDSLNIKYLPSETNFLLVKTGVWSKEIFSNLYSKEIMVRHQGSNPMLKNYLRISMGTPEENTKFRSEFKKIWENKLLVFDMDGTLIDVDLSYIKSIKDTVAHYSNDEISADEIDEIRNMGGYNCDWDLTEYALQQRNITIDKQELIDKFESYYSENKKSEKWLLPIADLQKINEEIPLAIFSGRPNKDIEYALDFFGVKELFSWEIGQEDTGEKSKPSGYGLSLLKEKSKAELIVYVGDTVDDILASLDANCTNISLIDNPKTDYYISDITEITNLILG